MQNFKDKKIWIIGASSGIGKALAVELDKRGAALILSSRRKDNLQELQKNLIGKNHLILPVDVSDYAGLSQAYSKIIENYTVLDSAIFMAAIYSPHSGEQKHIDDIHRMLNVNIGGAFNMTDLIVPDFKKRQSGQVVLCASVAGYRGLPMGQPYCASKAALINLGESLRTELSADNVDVKIICPGFVRTPLTDKNKFDMPMMIEPEQAAQEIANGLLTKKFELHFPKRFTIFMKILKLLPHALYFQISKLIMKKAQQKNT